MEVNEIQDLFDKADRKRRDRRAIKQSLLAIALGTALAAGIVVPTGLHLEAQAAERTARIEAAVAARQMDEAFALDLAREKQARYEEKAAEKRAQALEELADIVKSAKKTAKKIDGRVLDKKTLDKLDTAIKQASKAESLSAAQRSTEAVEKAVKKSKSSHDEWKAEEKRKAEAARKAEAERVATQAPPRTAPASSTWTPAPAPTQSGTPQKSSTPSSGGKAPAPAPAPGKKAPAKPAAFYGATQLASQHGVTVKYQACRGDSTSHISESTMRIRGCYGGHGATTILLHPVALQAKYDWQKGLVLNVTRHEVAHVKIRQHCGVSSPSITNGRTEQVTDAYAALYLGASSASGGYGYTSADAAAAKKIRAGQCS